MPWLKLKDGRELELDKERWLYLFRCFWTGKEKERVSKVKEWIWERKPELKQTSWEEFAAQTREAPWYKKGKQYNEKARRNTRSPEGE